MPTATSTQAGRDVVLGSDPSLQENVTAKFARKRDEARRAEEARRADVRTPIGQTRPAFATETLPDPPLFDGAPAPAPARPAATFTIHALIDDFPFDVSFTGSADQLAATVQRLRDLGAVPPTLAARAAVEAEKERSAPVCEFHGPMKESSKRPGTYYCPAKMGNGDYCKSKG